MRPLIVLVLSVCWGTAALGAEPSLAAVQKVYLLPMVGGLDQYLADRITREGLFTVVVDPKQADAVWSERADAGLTAALDDLYAPPKKKEEPTPTGFGPPSVSRRSASRSRGNIFLVGVGSRQVIWSTFLNLDDTSPKGLSKSARQIVQQVKRGLKKE
jgi:hypothetical protein